MNNGWIKLHRKITESLVFGNEKALKIWIWCLLKANHSDNTFLLGRSKLSLKSGQFVMGSEKAVDELKIAKATIWYWLNFLEKEGQVRLQKNTKYTIVTIPKWETYQHELDTNETPSRKQIERQVGTNKNEKNVKNDKKYSAEGAEVLKAFEEVDPKNKTYYGNTTQRSACDFLLSEYGLEKVLAAVSVLPQINQKKLYISQVTTPYELKENWVKIKNAMAQLKDISKKHNEPNFVL